MHFIMQYESSYQSIANRNTNLAFCGLLGYNNILSLVNGNYSAIVGQKETYPFPMEDSDCIIQSY